MIVETSGWRHLKEKNKLFLSCEYQKMYTASPKTTQLSKIVSNQKWKTLFLPYDFFPITTNFTFDRSKATAKRLQDMKIDFQKVYVSAMDRAKESGNIIASILGMMEEPEADELLNEGRKTGEIGWVIDGKSMSLALGILGAF